MSPDCDYCVMRPGQLAVAVPLGHGSEQVYLCRECAAGLINELLGDRGRAGMPLTTIQRLAKKWSGVREAAAGAVPAAAQ